MKITHDKEADAKYIYLTSHDPKNGFSARTEQLTNSINVDYAKDGTIFGVEILDASENKGALFVFGNTVSFVPIEVTSLDGEAQIDVKVSESERHLSLAI